MIQSQENTHAFHNVNYTIDFPENYIKPLLPGRDAWCAALRSGEYKQGRDRLCSYDGEDKYCCLGVLSEIQGRLDSDWRDNGGSDAVLSQCNPLSSLLGPCGSLGYMWVQVGLKQVCSLAGLNDAGVPFSDIADIIESVWDDGGELPT